MKYNFDLEKSVVVITPTTGSIKLKDAILSVENQSYKNIKHLIVIDGPEYFQDTLNNISISHDNSKCIIASSPFNTGGGSQGYYGHRIYAAYSHLVNADYVFFLDDDNWYHPDHVETLVRVLEQGNDFSYSLRQIYDKDKNYICDDNCESLGKWPIYFTNGKEEHFLIDTSSFAFRREFLIQVSQLWHHGWGGDRNFFYNVRDKCKFDTNGKHTLCYRVDGNPGSVSADFFLKGNEEQLIYYEGKLPWLK